MSGLNEVLLSREGVFKRVNIEPLWSGEHIVVTRDGIEAGDYQATARFPYAPDGAPVEILADDKGTSKGGGKTGISKRVGKKNMPRSR